MGHLAEFILDLPGYEGTRFSYVLCRKAYDEIRTDSRPAKEDYESKEQATGAFTMLGNVLRERVSMILPSTNYHKGIQPLRIVTWN